MRGRCSFLVVSAAVAAILVAGDLARLVTNSATETDVYRRSGNRSGRAMDTLVNLGCEHASEIGDDGHDRHDDGLDVAQR